MRHCGNPATLAPIVGGTRPGDRADRTLPAPLAAASRLLPGRCRRLRRPALDVAGVAAPSTCVVPSVADFMGPVTAGRGELDSARASRVEADEPSTAPR